MQQYLNLYILISQSYAIYFVFTTLTGLMRKYIASKLML